MSQVLNLDITPGAIPPIANCSQCDIGKEIELVIYDGTNGTFTIPDDAIVSIMGTKPDNHPFMYSSDSDTDVISYSGSAVKIVTPVQMTACAGEVECEIKIKTSTSAIYSANFILDVEESALPQDEDLSNMDVPLIIKAINAGEAIYNIDEKIEQATEILSHMSDNTEQSDADAKSASESATAAAKYATAAQVSQTEAKTSEANAKTSETNAKTSETNAKTSETNAEKSAELSRSWAVGGTGVRSGENSDNSKYYAEQSKSSAETAVASAAEAKGYAESNYALTAQSYAVGGTGTRTDEDTDNAKYFGELSKYYYDHIKDTDVGHLAELEARLEKILTSVNHTQDEFPAFFADRLGGITDLNMCLTNGLYQFVADASNAPFNTIGLLAVFNSAASGETGYVAQFAWHVDDAHVVYARDDYGGIWGAWQQLGIGSTAFQTIQSQVTALVGEDAGKSARAIALEELTKQLVPENERITTIEGEIGTLQTQIETIEGEIGTLQTQIETKAEKATTLAGYGITNGATKTELATVADEVNARPSTRKLSTQTLTAEGGTLTWTDSCITDDSLIDVYASIANIAPSEITQSGTTVTVTFDAQDADFQVAIVVMN